MFWKYISIGNDWTNRKSFDHFPLLIHEKIIQFCEQVLKDLTQKKHRHRHQYNLRIKIGLTSVFDLRTVLDIK